jgi:hypothetical protein
MHHRFSPYRCLLTILVVSVLSVRAGADTLYKIQPIVKLGDKVGAVVLRGAFQVGSLSDDGQIIFNTIDFEGGDEVKDELYLYAEGMITPLVVANGVAPTGKWPKRVGIQAPVSMNRHGDVVVNVVNLAADSLGLFLRDHQARNLIPVALKGRPAAPDLTITLPWGRRPVINNLGEIVFTADTKNSSGKPVEPGVFWRRADGQLITVVIPGQALPDGGQVRFGWAPSLSDSGRVGLLVVPKGKDWPYTHGYAWENGALTLVAAKGATAPGGGTIAHVDLVWVNNQDRGVLVSAVLNDAESGPRALYRFVNGRLLAAAIPGQPMPGGGTFESCRWHGSFPNAAGQYGFAAAITEAGVNRTAAYLLQPDGTLSLILKSGTRTEFGEITKVEWGGAYSLGVGLNNNGQIALPVRFNDGPDTIVLLTPTVQ